jgi:hypothetical protein
LQKFCIQFKVLKLPECTEIRNAKNRIHTSKKQTKSIDNNHSRIIATLTLGFWTSLFRNEYAPLWHKHLKELFPNLLSKHRTPKYIFEKLRSVRDFRNRVFHHEPIWHWRNLLDRYQEVIDALCWLSPVLKISLNELDRFGDIYNKGRENLCIFNNQNSITTSKDSVKILTRMASQ